MKSLVNWSHDSETCEFTYVVNKFKIQEIIFKKLQIKNEFTIREIQTQWDKNVFKLEHWYPGDVFVEQSLNELLSTSLTKTFISVGSRTVMQYKIK